MIEIKKNISAPHLFDALGEVISDIQIGDEKIFIETGFDNLTIIDDYSNINEDDLEIFVYQLGYQLEKIDTELKNKYKAILSVFTTNSNEFTNCEAMYIKDGLKNFNLIDMFSSVNEKTMNENIKNLIGSIC